MNRASTSKPEDHDGMLWRLLRILKPDRLTVSKAAEMNVREHKGLTGQDIITVSTQDWLDLWTRKQRFVLQFARQGNRVLYVETQFHWLSYIRQFRKQWRRIYLFLLGPRLVEENLYVYTPPLLLPAFQVYPFLAAVNNAVLAVFLRKVMRTLGMKSPVLWLYTHYNKPLVKKLGCKKALYECVDDYAGAKGLIRARAVQKQEAETLRSVDAAIVTADSLKPPKVKYNRNIRVVPNAANVSHFNRAISGNEKEPDELTPITRPRLVFLGMTACWVDLDLLEHIAAARATWQIVLVGPWSVNINRFDNIQNVHFLGRKPYDVLPRYLAFCDVALNPYKVDDVARGCSPLKLYEYLAAGLPIVSTEMPEARKFDGLVRVAASCDEFVAHIEEILAWDKDTRSSYLSAAVEESKRHSWENRFLEVERITMVVLR